MAFKAVRGDGATWISGAGGYIKDGKLVSTTPEYDDAPTIYGPKLPDSLNNNIENKSDWVDISSNNVRRNNPVNTVVSTNKYNTPSISSNTSNNTSSYNNDIWDKFMKWATPYMQRPTTEVPTYESISEQITNQMTPLHQQQELQLQQSQDEAIRKLAANLAGRGVYNSDINDEKAAEIYNKGDNARALADASFDANVGNVAQSIYRSEKSAAVTAGQQYNQSMINLGLAMLNGMIDMNKFMSDDAYRNTQLAALFGNTALSNFGTVK